MCTKCERAERVEWKHLSMIDILVARRKILLFFADKSMKCVDEITDYLILFSVITILCKICFIVKLYS